MFRTLEAIARSAFPLPLLAAFKAISQEQAFAGSIKVTEPTCVEKQIGFSDFSVFFSLTIIERIGGGMGQRFFLLNIE